MGVEVDLIIETNDISLAIEIKSSRKAQEKMLKGINKFEEITKKQFKKYLVYIRIFTRFCQPRLNWFLPQSLQPN